MPEKVTGSNGLSYQSNSKHTEGGDGNRANAGIEPKNSLDLFDNSIATSNATTRLAIDSQGNVHRFQRDPNGVYHWNGSTGDANVPMSRNRELRPYNAELRQLGWRGR